MVQTKIVIEIHPEITVADEKMHAIEQKKINYDAQTRRFLRQDKTLVLEQEIEIPALPEMGLDALIAQIDKNHAQMRTLEQNIKENEAKMARLKNELESLKKDISHSND